MQESKVAALQTPVNGAGVCVGAIMREEAIMLSHQIGTVHRAGLAAEEAKSLQKCQPAGFASGEDIHRLWQRPPLHNITTQLIGSNDADRWVCLGKSNHSHEALRQ